MSVHSILRTCATDLLDTEPTVTVEQVVNCAYRRHGGEFTDAAEKLILASARAIVANLMRDLSSDEGDAQLTLPGLDLPSALAIPAPSGTYYVRTDKATWTELVLGREVRAENVDRAQAKLDAYDESLETLRPVMEDDPTLSVADALDRLANPTTWSDLEATR